MERMMWVERLAGTEALRVAKFLAVGVLNTVVGLGVIYACKYFGRMDDVLANAIGYGVGLTNSFFWNRQWTFGHTGAILPAAGRFLMVFCLAYAANLATVLCMIKLVGLNGYIAQAIGVAPYTTLFYLGSRNLAFAR